MINDFASPPIPSTCHQRLFDRSAVSAFAAFLFLLAFAQAILAEEKSLLWKSNPVQMAVYVLGSIHFLKKQNYPLKKDIEDAFAQSRKVVLEINLDALDPQTTDKITLQRALNAKGVTLEQNVSPETFALAEKRARDIGVDIRALNPFKTWSVALTLSTVKMRQLGFDPAFGVDRYLAQRAKDAGKSIAGLETLEDQIGIFDHLSRSEQESMLRQTVEEMNTLETSIDRIVEAWLKGDSSLLEQSLLAGMREYPQLYSKLILERNQRWLPQIEAMIKQGDNALIVVGAAHLVGKDGLIQWLKQRGYLVEQMCEQRAEFQDNPGCRLDDRDGARGRNLRQSEHRETAHGKASNQSATGSRK